MEPPSSRLGRLTARLLIFTIAASAMLQFVIQPLVARLMLPRFGGESATWNGIMTALGLAGVAGFLAAWLLAFVRGRRWGVGVVMVGAVLVLVFSYADRWRELTSATEYLLPFCLFIPRARHLKRT
jgi:hypothetical protein